MPAISNTDLKKVIAYLEDAEKVYSILSSMKIQKFNSRAFMIRGLVKKLERIK